VRAVPDTPAGSTFEAFIGVPNGVAWRAASHVSQCADPDVGLELGDGRVSEGEADAVANQYVDRVADKPEAPITLAEAGIDKNLAHRARTYAVAPLMPRPWARFGRWRAVRPALRPENARVTLLRRSRDQGRCLSMMRWLASFSDQPERGRGIG
jgi:hypothetical protein